MSLSQLALRLAVVEALAPHALLAANAAAGWPTLAHGRVADSDIPPQAATDDDARRPVILVFTDATEVEPQGTAQDVFEAFESVTLAFEVMVPVRLPETDNPAPVAQSDPLAEAMLDLMAEQIDQTLARARMEGALRHVLTAIAKGEQRGWQDADSGLRLSARRLEWTCRVRRTEPFPRPWGANPLERLPQPLRDVAASLPALSYGRVIAETLAVAMTEPAAFAQLQELRFAANLARAAGETPPPRDPAASPRPVGDIGGTIDTTP